MALYVPDRGDIIHLSFDPSLGSEQRGARYALVLSPKLFNRLGMCMACPITQGGNFARGQAWVVSLTGTGLNAQGVVLCNQARMLDWKVRKASFSESAPDYVTQEVLARLIALLE